MSHRHVTMALLSLTCFFGTLGYASQNQCKPLVNEEVIKPKLTLYTDSANDTFCTFRLELAEDFKGIMSLDRKAILHDGLKVAAVSPDTVIYLQPMIDKESRVCEFVSDTPLRKGLGFRIDVPEGLLHIKPDVIEVDEIDIDEDLLSTMSVAGAWHKSGSVWRHQGMFSVIDDDSLDGQIPSSKPVYLSRSYLRQ